jgi:hypothetical protein
MDAGRRRSASNERGLCIEQLEQPLRRPGRPLHVTEDFSQCACRSRENRRIEDELCEQARAQAALGDRMRTQPKHENDRTEHQDDRESSQSCA